jgi:hypothetical protein
MCEESPPIRRSIAPGGGDSPLNRKTMPYVFRAASLGPSYKRRPVRLPHFGSRLRPATHPLGCMEIVIATRTALTSAAPMQRSFRPTPHYRSTW